MKLSGGGQKIEGDNQNYSYKAYLFSLLSASMSAKQYQMSVCGWMQDKGGAYDDTARNDGYIARKAWTASSATKQFVVLILLDAWMQRRDLLDGMDFHLELQLNEPKFALQVKSSDPTAAAYKIDIQKCELWIRQVNVSPSVIKGHATGLEKHKAIYPYNGHRINDFLIGAGPSSYCTNNAFQGCFPKLVIMGLVDHTAYKGN